MLSPICYAPTKLQIHLTVSNSILRCIIGMSKITRSETLGTALNPVPLIIVPFLVKSIILLVVQTRNQSHP